MVQYLVEDQLSDVIKHDITMNIARKHKEKSALAVFRRSQYMLASKYKQEKQRLLTFRRENTGAGRE